MKYPSLVPPLLVAVLALLWMARREPATERGGEGAGIVPSVERPAEGPSSAPVREEENNEEAASPSSVSLTSPAPASAEERERKRGEIAWAVTVCDDFRQHLHAGKSARAADTARGRERLERRREALLYLMREDPERANAAGLTFAEREALPPEWLDRVEERFSTTGEVRVIPSCGDPGGPEELLVTLAGRNEAMRGRAWGMLRTARSKRGVPVEGIALEGWTALAENGVRPVKGREREAALRRFPAAAAAAPDSPDAPAALIAGTVRRFPDEAALTESRELLARVMALPGPDSAAPFTAALEEEEPPSAGTILQAASAAASTWTESPKTVLVLNCVFPNKTTAVGTRAQWVAVMKEVSDWMLASSYGKTSLTATVPPNVIRLPSRSTVYEAEERNWVLLEDAKKLALEAGFDPEDYDISVVAFPKLNWNWGGKATVGGGEQWLNGTRNAGVVAHEFGHNYGVFHANSWDANDRTVLPATGAPGDTDPRHTEYGDLYSVMGASSSYPAGDISPHGKADLNWIPPERVTTVTAPGVYRIHRFDHAGASAHPSLALKLQRGASQTFWIGHRRNFKTNTSLSGGAYVIWQYDDRSARLLDMTPDSKKGNATDKGDAALAVGKTFRDPTSSLFITPTAKGGTAPNEWLDVKVEFSIAGNREPTVTLTPPAGPVRAREAVTFSAAASDPDGDALTYAWDFGEGKTAAGPAVTWTFQAGGPREVKLRVTDGKGGLAEAVWAAPVEDPLVRLEAVETPGSHPPEGAVFYRGLHVGSGDDGAPARSADGGSTWRAGRAREYPFTVYGLAAGPAGIVIPGAQEEEEDGEGTGAMETSADGVSWRLTAFPGLSALNAAVYGHGKWVAVGNAGAVLTSADGAAWAEHTIPGDRDLLGVVAAEKGFVASGKEGSLFTSADGAVWTRRKTPDTWPWPAGLTAVGSTVACVGVYEDMWWSADSGVTWEARPHGLPDFYPRFLIHGEGLWVAAESRFQEESSTYDWLFAVSRDGREWSFLPARTAPVWISWLTIQDGRLWLFAQGQKPLRSALLPAGNTPPALTVPWPAALAPRAETALTAAAGDAEGDAVSVLWERSGEDGYQFGNGFRGEILIGGARTLTARASDGRGGHTSAERTYFVEDPLLEWKDITPHAWDGTGEWSAAQSPARALLLRDREASSAPLERATDLVAWTKVDLPWRGRAVTWGGAGFVAVGQAYFPEVGAWRASASRSHDGVTWETPRELPGAEASAIATAADAYVAVGLGGMIARSGDGGAWVTVPSGTARSLTGVAFLGARGLAAGGGVLLSTTDSGRTWTDITPMSGGGEITGVLAARDLLFVSTSGGLRVLTPATGAWADAKVDTAQFGDIRSLVFHDGVLLALSQKQDPATLPLRSFLLASRDGLTWEGTEMPGGREARALLASGSTLLAVGPGGFFANGPAARLRLLSWGPGRTPGQWDLTVASTPGHRYQAQESADLLTWTPLGEELTATAGETTLTVPAPEAGGAPRYFRVSMREP